MAQIWSTGPAHIFCGVAKGRTVKPPPVPLQQSLSEQFANLGGGVKEAAFRGGLPPAFGDDAFNLRGVEGAPPMMEFDAIPQFDIAPRARQNPIDRAKPVDPGPHPRFNHGPGRGLTQTSNRPVPSESQDTPETTRVPQYLGTAEKVLTIDVDEASEPWFTDEGGTVNPTDDMYAGQTATVTAVVNRFSQATLDRILSRPNPVTGVAGRNSSREFGELAGLERGGFVLYIVFPNFGMAAYTRSGEVMPGGYRFWFAKLVSSQIVPGTQAQKAAVRFVCRQAWQATRHTSPETHAPVERGATESILFDYDVTAARAVGIS